MRRYGWIGGALVIIILLVVIEMKIISNASGYEVREKVVFAAADIDENTVITGEMLEIREIGSDAVHRDAVRSFDEAVNKWAAASIQKGEMLLNGRLTAEAADCVKVLDKSNRLFCVALDADQANAWQLTKDQPVDVIYVPNYGEQNDAAPEAAGVVNANPLTTGVRVMKNIRVAGLVDDDGELIDTVKSGKIPRYVLFEVTAEQAVFLAYAKSSGRIELSCILDK